MTPFLKQQIKVNANFSLITCLEGTEGVKVRLHSFRKLGARNGGWSPPFHGCLPLKDIPDTHIKGGVLDVGDLLGRYRKLRPTEI
jgi:hypothetical protein